MNHTVTFAISCPKTPRYRRHSRLKYVVACKLFWHVSDTTRADPVRPPSARLTQISACSNRKRIWTSLAKTGCLSLIKQEFAHTPYSNFFVGGPLAH